MAVLVSALLGVSAAQAQDAAETRQIVTNPDWVKRPTAESLLSVWPKESMSKGIGGRAVIGCDVSRQGVLVKCMVVSESPEGSGFGQAAIAMTPQLLMSPKKIDGVAVDGGKVQIPLTFQDMGGSTDGTVPAITIRRWIAAPTYAQVAAAYPAKARARKVGGRVVLSCRLASEGKLGECAELVVQPTGLNLGLAAKSLKPYFTGPATIEGKSTKGMVTQILVVFTPEMLSSTSPQVGKPDWVTLPTAAELTAALPADESLTGTARIRLDCAVGAQGKVDDCKVQSEDPPGKGLGTKAIELAKYFQLTIWSQEGLPTVGGRITIPLRYELGDLPAPPAKP